MLTSWHQDIGDAGIEPVNTLTRWLSLDPGPEKDSLDLLKGSLPGPVYDSRSGVAWSANRPK